MADALRHLTAPLAGAAGARAGWAASGSRGFVGVALAWALLLPAVLAQVPVPTVRFTVFAARPIPDVAFTPRASGAPQKLQFHPTSRSPRYEYRGTMPLRFVDSTNGEVVAEANIPAGMQDALLLFTPLEKPLTGGTHALRYQIAVLDDAPTRHAPGGLAIINLSGLSLSGTINHEKVTLKAGLNPALPIGKSAKVTLNTVFKNRRYQSFSSTVTLGRNERALLLLLPPFYAGGLEVQSRLLVDQPPGAAPPVTR